MEGYNITFTAEGFPEGGVYTWSAATSIGGNAATATISSASTNGVMNAGIDDRAFLRATATYSVGGGGAGCRLASSNYTILAACPYTGSDLVTGSCYQASTGAQNWRATINDARVSGMATLHPTEGRKYYNIVRMPDNKWWFADNVNFQKDLTWEASADSPFTTTTNGVPGIGHFWCPGGSSGAVATSNRAGCNLWGALYTWETAMMVDGKYSDDTKANSTWVEPTASYCTYTTDATMCTQNAGRGTGNHGICPNGWYIPTYAEWTNMLNIVETGDKNIGTMLGWHGTYVSAILRSELICPASNPVCSGDENCYNRYYNAVRESKNPWGFSANAAGSRQYLQGSYSIFNRGVNAQIISSTPSTAVRFNYYVITYAGDPINAFTEMRHAGVSVRCAK
jgi:uncharacterized protein (TIGR02145 family)